MREAISFIQIHVAEDASVIPLSGVKTHRVTPAPTFIHFRDFPAVCRGNLEREARLPSNTRLGYIAFIFSYHVL